MHINYCNKLIRTLNVKAKIFNRGGDIIKSISRVIPGELIGLIIVWIILVGSFSYDYLLAGLIISSLAVFFTSRVLLVSDFSSKKQNSIFQLIAYFLMLLIEIYKAGFEQVYRVITMKINPGFIEIETNLYSSMNITYLANSITLKPGTISVVQREKSILVLCINMDDYKDKEDAEVKIKGKIEKLLGGKEWTIIR